MSDPGMLKPGRRCAVVAAIVVIGFMTAVAGGQAKPAGSADTGPIQVNPAGIIKSLVTDSSGMDIRLVLRLLTKDNKKNIVTTKEVSGTITAALYNLTFKEALDAVVESSGFVYREKGNVIYVYTPEQLAAILKSEKKMATRVFRVTYLTATDAKTLLSHVVSPEGTITITPPAAVGIETSSTEAGGNSHASHDALVVRDYEENLKRFAELLKNLDVRPDQVLIEATILRATLRENNALGVDFNSLSGINFRTLNSTSTRLQSLTPGNLTSAELPGPGNSASTISTDFNSAITGGGLSIGFISNEIAFFIRALEGVTDLTIMANPKLLVVNKQRGEVFIGNEEGYLTTTITETVATQTVTMLQTGTRLVVRPFIGKDGYIRMEIHPEDSSGGVEQVGNYVLPKKTTTEVTSNVLVRDGHTIVIGGLFREETKNERSQVPLFGNIPYVGTLFRQTADATKREEVIILITPRIIKQAADEATSEMIKDDVERFRVGQRKGLQWWGRSRLAQTHLRWAKGFIRDGQRNRALWDVDIALSLAPRMEEAIRLKERLTNKAYWADQSQYSAAKYIIQRMIMQELGKPVERVIPPAKPRDADKLDPDTRKGLGIDKRAEDPLSDVLQLPVRPQVKTTPSTDDKDKGGDDGTDQPADTGTVSP